MILSDRIRQAKNRPARARGSLLFGDKGSYNTQVTNELLVGFLIGADFNTTADQSITITTGYRVTKITVTNASLNMTTAAGGFYSAGAKGGTQLVASTQVYTALTSASVILSCTMNAIVAGLSAVVFSLTTGQGSAATADIRIYGVSSTLAR